MQINNSDGLANKSVKVFWKHENRQDKRIALNQEPKEKRSQKSSKHLLISRAKKITRIFLNAYAYSKHVLLLRCKYNLKQSITKFFIDF